MRNTFTFFLMVILTGTGCFAQPPDTVNPWPVQECQVGFEVAVMESYPPQYVFIPSKKDSLAFYSWDFGDNTYSNEMNPVHVFDISDTYQVCLFYTSPDSCTSYYCESLSAQGTGANCKAYWIAYGTYYTESPITDSSVSPVNNFYAFQDQSRGDVIQWKWDFGDGTSSLDQNPVHQFENSGIFHVSLEIVTSDGCSSTYAEDIYIGQPQLCDYTGTVKNYTGLDGCGLVIVLDNGTVLEPVEIVPNIVLYDGQRVRLGYTELKDRASICMIGLIVRIDCIFELGQDSCSSEFTHYSLPWVSSVPPIYRFEMLYPDQVNEAVWDFGDGTVTNELAPDHRFERDDYYTVCLTVKTGAGCISTTCETSFYDGRDPLPVLCDNFIRLNTEIILNGQNCNGSATATLVDNMGNPVLTQDYLWSTGETGPVIYNLCPGLPYSIIVTDTSGCAVSGSFSFGGSTIYPDSLIGYWNYEQDYLDFIFNLPVYSDDVYCRWDFGDGVTAEGNSVSHSYDSEKNYTVEFQVFDTQGNLLYNQQILVSAGEPTAIGKTTLKSPVVYPVPAKEWLYLALPDADLIVKKIEILSSGGQTLMVVNEADQQDHQIGLNVSQLPSGFYIGKLSYQNGVLQTFRFVK